MSGSCALVLAERVKQACQEYVRQLDDEIDFAIKEYARAGVRTERKVFGVVVRKEVTYWDGLAMWTEEYMRLADGGSMTDENFSHSAHLLLNPNNTEAKRVHMLQTMCELSDEDYVYLSPEDCGLLASYFKGED